MNEFNFKEVSKNFKHIDYSGQERNRFNAWGYDEEGENELWSLSYQNSSELSTLTLKTHYLGRELKIRLLDPNIDSLEFSSNYIVAYLNNNEITSLNDQENLLLGDIIYSLLNTHNLFDIIQETSQYTPKSTHSYSKNTFSKESQKLSEQLKQLPLEKLIANDSGAKIESSFIISTRNISKDDRKVIKYLYKKGSLSKNVRTINAAYEYLK